MTTLAGAAARFRTGRAARATTSRAGGARATDGATGAAGARATGTGLLVVSAQNPNAVSYPTSISCKL